MIGASADPRTASGLESAPRFRGFETVKSTRPLPWYMVTKRSLAASLLLLGLAFLGVFHTIAAFAFDSGLEYVGLGIAGLALLGLVLVNIPADESDDGESGDVDAATDGGPDEK